MNYEDFLTLLSRVFSRSVQLRFREQPDGLLKLLHDRGAFLRAFYAPDGMAELPQLAVIAPDVAEAIDELKLLDLETFTDYLLRSTDSSTHQAVRYLDDRVANTDRLYREKEQQLNRQVESAEAKLSTCLDRLVTVERLYEDSKARLARAAQEVEKLTWQKTVLPSQRVIAAAKKSLDAESRRKIAKITIDWAALAEQRLIDQQGRIYWQLVHQHPWKFIYPTCIGGSYERRDVEHLSFRGIVVGSDRQVWYAAFLIKRKSEALSTQEVHEIWRQFVKRMEGRIATNCWAQNPDFSRESLTWRGHFLGWIDVDQEKKYRRILSRRKKQNTDALSLLVADRQYYTETPSRVIATWHIVDGRLVVRCHNVPFQTIA